MPDHEKRSLYDRLERDSLLRRVKGALRTTRRWQAAMMRAAARLLAAGHAGDDLRVPVVLALVDVYGDETTDEEIAMLAYVMMPIEVREIFGEYAEVERAG